MTPDQTRTIECWLTVIRYYISKGDAEAACWLTIGLIRRLRQLGLITD